MKTLIGSQALKSHFPDTRKPKDTDYFSQEKIPGAETFWHPLLEQWDFGDVATIDELYTIKVSHSFWELRNGSWNKHMFDILFLQSKGAKVIPGLYDLLYQVWEERYGKKKANLEASPKDFFNNKVVRLYDHDSIHASIAYYDTPLFERILRDNSMIAVDLHKFDSMSLEDKLRLVREEVYATALERKMIPSDYAENPAKAYSWALRKTITSFSKGWFPLFIVTHFNELKSPEIKYVERHFENKDKLILL